MSFCISSRDTYFTKFVDIHPEKLALFTQFTYLTNWVKLKEVLMAISESAEKSLSFSSSITSRKIVKKIPGWNDQVRPYRENAKFWFSVWISAGKPLNCELQNIMRRTKNIYHYQVKKCKKAEDQIKKDKLLSALLDPDSEIDLFKEIKNMRKANTLSANKIDDKTKNIEEHFAGLYKTLYNSVDDQDSLQDVASIKLDEKMVDKHANDEKNDDKNK